MRILFFSTSFPNPLHPGQAIFNRAMIRGLAAEHDVRVVSPIPWTVELAAWRAGRGVDRSRVHELDGVAVDYPRFYYPPGLWRHTYDRWMWRSVGRSLDATMLAFCPDVVLSYWAHPDGAVAVRAAHARGIPAVTMVGGSDVLVLARQRKRATAIREALERADGVIAVSRDIANRLRGWGLAEERLAVVRRGIDTDVFRPGDKQAARRRLGITPSGRVLISVGRLVPVKGHDVLVEACRLLREREVDFTCYVLGEGPARERLQRQIHRHCLDEFVRLQGNCRQEDLADWYRAADVTAIPSRSEGVPNVLLEAISCGTPFVASGVGGIPEIADCEHDRLVPPEDARLLAEAIELKLLDEHSPLPRKFLPSSWCDSSRELAGVLSRAAGATRTKPPALSAKALPSEDLCPIC